MDRQLQPVHLLLHRLLKFASFDEIVLLNEPAVHVLFPRRPLLHSFLLHVPGIEGTVVKGAEKQ